MSASGCHHGGEGAEDRNKYIESHSCAVSGRTGKVCYDDETEAHRIGALTDVTTVAGNYLSE